MDTSAVRIDGSRGEGGGQILRTALALSVLTGRSLQLAKIRAGRNKPGLMPQHLKAVEAAAAISGAETTGALPGSQELTFIPHAPASGDYQFDISTAGSTSLVLQTILLPLAAGAGESVVTVTGGTHVPFSPSFDYLARHWSPFLQRLGIEIEMEMAAAGFYPRGGGRVTARLQPAMRLFPLQAARRGRLRTIHCLSLAANLPSTIAKRQALRARERLAACGGLFLTEISSPPSPGRGTMLMLLAEFEESRCAYFALGERGKPAEQVADEAADLLLAFLRTNGAIDEHLADQLVLPLALADGQSELRTCSITTHLQTNAWVISQFLPVKIQIDGRVGEPGAVQIRGVPLRNVNSLAKESKPRPEGDSDARDSDPMPHYR